MPQPNTPGDQVKFLSQWFLSWSEMQREDFLPVLLQAYQPSDNLNGLVGGYESLGTRGRRPSLFDCQMKLFHDWFGAWTEADRQTLLEDLRELDPEFMRQYEKRRSGEEAPLDEPSAGASAAEEGQDSQNPSSSVSSPPSTLPRSHSPHDSGLDEPVDSESTEVLKDDLVGSVDDSNTTLITINTDSSSNTTTATINTPSSPPLSPPSPPVKSPVNNVTVVEVGGGEDGGGGGEVVFNMQEIANGLPVVVGGSGGGDVVKVSGGDGGVEGTTTIDTTADPPAATTTTTTTTTTQQDSEAVSAEH